MIPKIIHYCWFGGREKGDEIERYIATWKKYFPDWTIQEWNEQNFDLHCCRYVEEAYASKKYAFVSDYVRLYALYSEGGIYFDTDIEVRRSFSHLLEGRSMVLGFEDAQYVMTGFMASAPGQKCLAELLETYRGKRFLLEDGRYDTLPNPVIVTETLNRFGLVSNGVHQFFGDGYEIYPWDVFSAFNIAYQRLEISANTLCVHHCMGTWQTRRDRIKPKIKSILLRIIGPKAFDWFKEKLYKRG